MSNPHPDSPSDQPQDVVESIVPLMPVVLPVVGALLMFLLAFIAVTMPERARGSGGQIPSRLLSFLAIRHPGRRPCAGSSAFLCRLLHESPNGHMKSCIYCM